MNPNSWTIRVVSIHTTQCLHPWRAAVCVGVLKAGSNPYRYKMVNNLFHMKWEFEAGYWVGVSLLVLPLFTFNRK